MGQLKNLNGPRGLQSMTITSLWHVEKEKPGGGWKRVDTRRATDQHDAEQWFFSVHLGVGRLVNHDRTITVRQKREDER